MKCFILLLCLICNLCQGAALLCYVDTGSSGGNGTSADATLVDGTQPYSSLAAAVSARAQDLTDAGGDTFIIHCNRTNGGGMDVTTFATWASWTTSATNTLTITQDDWPGTGIYDNTKYVLHNNDGGTTFFTVNENYVNFTNFQLLSTTTSTNFAHGIYINGIVGANQFNFTNCIFKGACTGTGGAAGLYAVDSDTNVTVVNCTFDGFNGDNSFAGAWCNGASHNFYNCTFYNNYFGINQTAGTVTAANCALFGNFDDLDATITADYCASDDGDGSNPVDISPGTEATDWAAAFTDYANGDFSVKNASSVLYNTASDTYAPATDIIGTARPQVTLDDIGAFEFVPAAPSSGGQVIMIMGM